MAVPPETRSKDNNKILLGQLYKEETEFCVSSQLKSGRYIIGRMLSLCSKNVAGSNVSMSKMSAAKLVAEEIRNDWVQKNVYPIGQKDLEKKIEGVYNEFQALYKVSKTPKNKSEAWEIKVKAFNNKMGDHAFDIRTKNKEYQRKLEEEYRVKMTDEDEAFYEDNCHGAYKAICLPRPCPVWEKQDKRKVSRFVAEQTKFNIKLREEEAQEIRKKEQLAECIADDTVEDPSDTDVELECGFKLLKPTEQMKKRETRQSSGQKDDMWTSDIPSFPDINVRTGHRSIVEPVKRCTVKCLADYKVSVADLSGIIVDVANIIFGQKWTV